MYEVDAALSLTVNSTPNMVQLLSGASSIVCAGLIASIVLSRNISEGIVIKIGLVMTLLGLLASGVITLKGFDSMDGLWNAALLLRSGLLIVVLGSIWRIRKHKERHP